MYEVKEGRGPSYMAAMGGLIAVGFAILWIGTCISMGAPIFFTLFGALFGAAGLASAIYNFWAARTPNRPDLFDVTTNREEPDPFNERARKL